MRLFLSHAYLFAFFCICTDALSNDHKIPNLVGTWVGVNNTLSEQRGYRSWEKKVEIVEQKDRRFKGTFSYTDGTKNFLESYTLIMKL